MKKRLLCIFLLLILLFSTIIIRFDKYYSVACNNFADTAVKGAVTSEVNNLIAFKLNENGIKYSDIATIERTNEYHISAITIDTIKINILANEIASDIYNEIYNINSLHYLPLGNALGYKYFSGKGPKIEISLLPLTFVAYTIKSEFHDAGINQTVHRIVVEFSTTINCVAPFHQKESVLNFPIVIAETLIVGKIPQILLTP